MYATTVTTFEAEWKSIQEVYNRNDTAICAYLAKEWIDPYKTQCIRCYTNQLSHFFNVVSSKGESGNAGLKRELRCSTGKRSFLLFFHSYRLISSRRPRDCD